MDALQRIFEEGSVFDSLFQELNSLSDAISNPHNSLQSKDFESKLQSLRGDLDRFEAAIPRVERCSTDELMETFVREEKELELRRQMMHSLISKIKNIHEEDQYGLGKHDEEHLPTEGRNQSPNGCSSSMDVDDTHDMEISKENITI